MKTVWHVVIHARPTRDFEYGEAEVNGVLVRSLEQGVPINTKFACSFEEVAQGFSKLPRMFSEPDGSFVWVVDERHTRHQLEGNVVDDGRHVLLVELKTTFESPPLIDRFLTTLGWPDEKLLFQLVRHGVFLEEDEFRRTVFA